MLVYTEDKNGNKIFIGAMLRPGIITIKGSYHISIGESDSLPFLNYDYERGFEAGKEYQQKENFQRIEEN